MSISQSEEYHKLHCRYKELKAKLKKMETCNPEQLHHQNEQLEAQIASQAKSIEVLCN
jgi:predicted nuclease with TOPRIM domain